VIDLSENGEFLGLDVIGASERLPLKRKQLSKVEDVEITVQEEEGNVMVTVVMKLGNEKTSLNLPVTGGMTGQVT
jgi:nitrate reductase NapAB chaperone NapD